MNSLKEFILILLYKQTFLIYILVKIVIYAIKRGEFCLSLEVWIPIYSSKAYNDETASINHQVNQSKKSTGPKFIEVISYNIQMVIWKGFFSLKFHFCCWLLKYFIKKFQCVEITGVTEDWIPQTSALYHRVCVTDVHWQVISWGCFEMLRFFTALFSADNLMFLLLFYI